MTKGRGKNPGASNLNKHVKRTEHKERSQPAHRKKLGQLEKHKDHVVRAKRRKQKVQRLTQLKRAAAQRNPDDFHIGMTKAVMDIATGRMKKRGARVGRHEKASELRKTMDHNARNVQYLEFKATADVHRAKELLDEDASAAITSSRPVNRHTVFVETEDEFRKFNALKHFDATAEMLKQHPAVRGTISVLKHTVLPEEVLLSGGHHMKSTAQRRKERKQIQEELNKHDATDAAARAQLVERLKAKKELKRYRFSDLVADAAATHRAGESRDEGEDNADAHVDEATRLVEWRREQEKQEALLAARRIKEISQRVERSKSLAALAKTVRRQNVSIKRQLTQKSDSRYKPNATRRAR